VSLVFLGSKMGVRGLLSFINSRHEEFFISMDASACKFVIGR
jgi:hypothetical protein